MDWNRACFIQLWEDISYLYIFAAGTYPLPSAEAVACTGMFRGRYIRQGFCTRRDFRLQAAGERDDVATYKFV